MIHPRNFFVIRNGVVIWWESCADHFSELNRYRKMPELLPPISADLGMLKIQHPELSPQCPLFNSFTRLQKSSCFVSFVQYAQLSRNAFVQNVERCKKGFFLKKKCCKALWHVLFYTCQRGQGNARQCTLTSETLLNEREDLPMAIWINDKNLLNKHFTVSSFHFQWKHLEAEGKPFGYAVNGKIAYLINDFFVYAYDLESGKMLFLEIYHGKMTNPIWYEEGPDGWNHLKQVTDVEIMRAV